jgi:hypothetical protein
MQRLFHIAFLSIIGISMVVQTTRFAITLSGGTVSSSGFLERAGMFVIAGGVIAFFGLILSLVRSWRRPAARVAALGYLVVLVWPLLLAGLNGWVGTPRQASINVSQRAAPLPSPDAPPSEQFLAGQAWAREHGPARRSDCNGSSEFVRGCFVQILRRREDEEAAGYRWASENRPQRGSDCRGKTPHQQLGCRKWYVEQPNAQREWPYGARTTAECEREVNADGELRTQLDLLEGNERGAASFSARHWNPELRQCQQIDRREQAPFMAAAYGRLDAIVAKMKAGGAATAEDNATFSRDYAEMGKIADQPYKQAYDKLATEFLARQAGTFKEREYPRISCDAYAAEIAKMNKLDAERSAEMDGLRRPGGVIVNGARFREVNKLRLDMLWDLKFYNDGAKAAGCAVARQ